MNNPNLIKNFVANSDISAKHIVCINGDSASQASAGHTANLGVAELACKSGDRVDVVMSGIAEVQAGDSLACGDFVTAGGAGGAVPADEGCTVLGVALAAASVGDYVPVLIAPGRPISTPCQPSAIKAGGDIEAGRLVTFSGGDIVQASSSSDNLVGVAMNNAADDEYCDVAITGVVGVTAGASVSAGAYVTTDSNGKAITATAGTNYIGLALNAASAADDMITLAIRPGSIAAAAQGG